MTLFNRNKQMGFSLIEMLLVVAIMGIVAAGFSQILWDSKKFQSHIELKGESVDFKNMTALTLKSSETCKKALHLDDDIVKFPKTAIPHYDGDTLKCPAGDDKCEKAVGIRLKKLEIMGREEYDTSSFSGGRVASGDDTVGARGTKINPRLYLHDLQIEFKKPLGGTGENKTTYITSLMIQMNKAAADASIGSPELRTRQPVIFKLAEDGNDFKVADCFLDSGDDPQGQCLKLGGRWLASSNNGGSGGSVLGITNVSCPKTKLDTGGSSGKCIFSNNYPLGPKELPDGIPCHGNQNELNERPITCFFKDGVKISEKICPARDSADTPGKKKCVFVNGEWQFVKQTGGTYKKLRACDEGVEVTKAPSGLKVYDWNDNGTNPLNPNALPDEPTILTGAARCLVDIERNIYKECTNADQDEGEAAKMEKKACWWINGTANNGKLSGAQATEDLIKKRISYCEKVNKNDPTECPPKNNLRNYKGWYYITGKNQSGKYIGIPCFEVEVEQ